MTTHDIEQLKETLIKQNLEAQQASTRMIADMSQHIKNLTTSVNDRNQKVDELYELLTKSRTIKEMIVFIFKLIVALGTLAGVGVAFNSLGAQLFHSKPT